MKRKILFAFLITIVSFPLFAEKKYARIELSGTVNPIVSEYIVDSIAAAQADGSSFVLLLMDTPGGLMGSMRDIIKSILTSKIPVIVYAYPKGAQAASAGGFIMISAHIAAMSPGTEIGAMHPVSPMLDFITRDRQGDPAGAMEKKVLNDTVAYAKSLAEKRGRNVSWVVDAVTRAKSSTYSEALRAGVIDLVAEDIDDLLKKIDGRTIDLNGAKYSFSTSGLHPVEYRMKLKQRIINYFADPQMVLLLFVIAIAGIVMEFKNPGMIVPGTLGGISLLMFLFAVKILPVNSIGLILIILSIVMFVLELNFTSYGLLTLVGVVMFISGSLLLIDSPLPGGGIPLITIFSTMLFILVFFFFIIRLILKAFREKKSSGLEAMAGLYGVAIRDFAGSGKIKVRGEIWNAFSDDQIARDEKVVVESVEGMTLKVKKIK